LIELRLGKEGLLFIEFARRQECINQANGLIDEGILVNIEALLFLIFL
jgi:hypothetical protein